VKRIALIGHRGVGKTSLLSRIERYSANRTIHIYDLDREIERATGRTVGDIFQNDGEVAFRRIERETFDEIASKASSSNGSASVTAAPVSQTPDEATVVALGAGFDVAAIPDEWHVIWVRRVTDEAGRIFTDRPRLDRHLSALDEYKERARAREPKYAARADAVLILDEGIEDANDPAERAYFTDHLDLKGATLTLRTENFARGFANFIGERLKWNLRWFELRDDLLTHEQIEEALKLIPPSSVLLSFRDPHRIEKTKSLLATAIATDWALELGSPQIEPTFLSLHNGRLDELETVALSLKKDVKLKAALPTETFADLMRGHHWQRQDPSKRIFLPMSEDSRWAWYRDHRRDYELNFIREDVGTASDQPTILQWQRKPETKTFAAVLGDPVKHSRTPMEHREFFAPRAVYAIRVPEVEFDSALAALRELGLTHAAVTAPLKHKAQELVQTKQAINTLAFVRDTVHATNTDLIGLRRAAELLPQAATQAVWGGGGTLDVIRQVFPQAQLVSVRTKRRRDTGELATPPELVIWAASLKHGEQSPPSDWRPRYVFDLNYSEASAARDYATKIGAIYISGLAMFKAQAQAQREFWETL
jgi:shikimate 5-dehydrogenase/shikimate kinase